MKLDMETQIESISDTAKRIQKDGWKTYRLNKINNRDNSKTVDTLESLDQEFCIDNLFS